MSRSSTARSSPERRQVREDLRPDRADRPWAGQRDGDPEPGRSAGLGRRTAGAAGPVRCQPAPERRPDRHPRCRSSRACTTSCAAGRRRRRSRRRRSRGRSGGHRGLASLPLTPTLASNVAAERAATPGIPFTAEIPQGAGPGRKRRACRRAAVHDGGTGVCTRLPDPCARRERVPDLRRGVLQRTARPVLRRAGNDLDRRAAVRDPNQTLRAGKRTYDLYYDGTSLQMVAWREYGAWYWVHNTLTDTIGNGELLAIAEQTEPLTPVTGAGARGRASDVAGSSPQSGARRRADPHRRPGRHDHRRVGRFDRRSGRAARASTVDDWAGAPPAPAPPTAGRADRTREPASRLLASVEADFRRFGGGLV